MFKNLAALIAVLITIAGCGEGKSDPPSAPQQTKLLAQVTQANDATTIHGYRDNYTIVQNVDGSVTLTNLIDHSSQSFAATLKTIKFADKFVSFDSSGIPGQSYRLYQAAFNRKPDLGGLGFWTHVLQGGLSLDAVAGYFYSSPEFQALYGQVNDDQFITLLYNNVLHRVPDQGGHDFWSLQMKNGLSRQGILGYFSESPENVGNAAVAIKNGIDYIPDVADIKIIPVQKSSYQNKMAAGNALGSQNTNNSGDAVAFADFFQDGTYSMVTNSLVYNPQDPNNNKTLGSIQFWKKIGDEWVDQTSKLLKDTTGCLHPRKAIVADFNGDGIPDVFIACHGSDAPPFPGEYQHVLLSQTDGTYKNSIIPITCYCHGASAADMNNNHFADIVVADPGINKQPYYLMNNKNGTFTPDYTRMPKATEPEVVKCAVACGLQIYSIELIDFAKTGRYDVWFGGNANDPNTGFRSSIFTNPGSNIFQNAARTILPAIVDNNYNLPLDILFVDGNIYQMVIRNLYDGQAIQKINYATFAQSTIYSHTGAYPNGGTWFDWMIFSNGKIRALSSTFNVEVPQ